MSPCPYCRKSGWHSHSAVIQGGLFTVDGKPWTPRRPRQSKKRSGR